MTTAAVVGLGDIAALHLAAIEADPRIQLVGVADTVRARAEGAAQRWGVPAFAHTRQLLASVRPDVVHVTTPHDQHAPVVLAALGSGAAVLTEKPVAHTVAEAERLAAAAAGARVGVVLQNRYNPSSIAIRAALDAGRIGAVTGARAAVWWSRPAAYYAAAPWRGRWSSAGGGTLINQAIHTIDLLLWFLGPAASVRGSAASLRGVAEVEDVATVACTHVGGATSLLFATTAHVRNDDVELEITGTAGSVRLVSGEARLATDEGETVLATDVQDSGARSYWGRGHQLLISDFHARLRAPEPFWLDLETGIAPLRVLRDVYRQSGLIPEGQEL